MPWFGSCAAGREAGLILVALGGIEFERDVARVLERSCLRCHDEAHAKGGLSLATLDGARRGGKSGEPAVVPGRPDESRLLALVSGAEGEKARMPKGGAALDDSEIAALRAWIEAGAPWPDGRTLADRSAEQEFERRLDWWSLKLLSRPTVPVSGEAGSPAHSASTIADSRAAREPGGVRLPGIAPPRNLVDPFVRAKLRERGLEPAPEADRRTLIRRVTFDLTGMPPSPEEVAAFLADPAPDAYERLVDRLLCSPRFGERFARPWLDLVHFGETHGYDKDKPRPNAWPYRDWVIASFNADKPYARFVEEQIAGDALYPGDADALVATGFLAAGPWDFVGHVELREGTVDKEITRNLDRDDVVTSVMSTFASTTVQCARCHDHKFDAIGQEDYYSLQVVFAGIERAEREFDRDPSVARRREQLVREQAALAAPQPAARERLGWHGEIAQAADTTQRVQVDLGRAAALDRVLLVPAHESYGGWPGPGFGFPVRFRVEVANEPSFAEPRLLLDETGEDVPNPGDRPFEVDARRIAARHIRVTATKLWQRTGDYAFALGELVVLAEDGRGDVALGAAAKGSSSIEAPPRWALSNLTDGVTWRGEIGEAGDVEPWLARERELSRMETELAALPPPSRVYAAASRFALVGAFTPPAAPRLIHVLERGDVKRPLREVGPGALRCVRELPARFDLPPDADEGARRAALARWLVDPRNPLTWRSIANRVWQWHFGQGIVDTPSDFGHMGAPPTHPELLDALAGFLLDHGGSLKALHRLIVTSSTYRQSSIPAPEALETDAGNKLLARTNRARLGAEEVRDALLCISGRLDLVMGGPSDRQFAFKDDHSPVYDYAGFDPDAAAGRRRSIYRFVVRSVPDPFLECLDCPDASLLAPKRNVTITALQALALLNDPFVLRQCQHLATRLEAQAPGDVDAQIARAFELALSRPPAPHELAAFADHARRHGLAAACRVLVNLNEFLFVD
jgi:cytochrome c553